MKKVIKYFVFLLLILISFTVKANAAVKFKEGNYVGKIYINKVKNGVTYYMRAQFLQKSDDNSYVYCLDPFDRFNANDTYKSSTTYSKLSSSALEKVKLAAYYGYGYTNRTSNKWYAITQLVIWKYADTKGNYYFTDTLNGKKITTYDKDIKALENSVKNHSVKPSFAEKTYTIGMGEKIVIKDTNSVLQNYSMLAEGGINVDKTSNQMTITGKNTQKTYKISLTKKSNRLSKNPVFYITSGAQNLMAAGNVSDINTYLNIKVVGGSINIIKHDKDTKSTLSSGKAHLDGAVYEVYKDNNKVGTININEDCKGSLSNLEMGDYTLKEVQAGTGYTVDKEEYSFTIDKDNLDKTLTLDNEVIKRKVIITKLYGDKETNKYEKEANISFDIYDEDNVLIKTITTDENGEASITLPYGKYVIKQVNSTKNYDMSSNQEIEIKEDIKEDMNITIKDEIKRATLKVYKLDSNTKKEIINNSASFTIKNLDTGSYVFHTIDGSVTNIFKTNKDGYFLTDITLSYGKYELKEVKSPSGYKQGKTITFEINEDSSFKEDEDKNKIFEIYYSNERLEKVNRISVPNTSACLSNTCWYQLLFENYLYEKKKYC